MNGKGRHTVLGVRSPDPILSVAAAVGLAVSAGTSLLVDLASPRLALGGRSLGDLAVDGPSLAELSPGRTGVAVLAGSGLPREQAEALLGRLATRWPGLVVRVDAPTWSFPVVPVVPLYPGRLSPVCDETAAVWQPVAGGGRPPGPGPVLPPLRPSTLRRILSGGLPGPDRWVRAWRPVWEMPWA